MQSLKYSKKLKKFQRDSLMPLYVKHAEYLCRMIKTMAEEDDCETVVIERLYMIIPSLIQSSKCHEVALNDANHFGFQIPTHQNPLGCEEEYTNHPDAKKVGRDLRVKLIWELVESELREDITLSKFKSYDASNFNSDKNVCCPFCNEILAHYELNVIGYHEDGTQNTAYQCMSVDRCACFLLQDDFGSVEFDETLDDIMSCIENNLDSDFDKQVHVVVHFQCSLKATIQIEIAGFFIHETLRIIL